MVNAYRQTYINEMQTQYFETDDFNKYYYQFKLTTGFIIGFVIDNIVPCTLGLPMKLLKDFGKVFFKTELRHRLIYKILSKPFIGAYLRGFLE